jgi:hypothetical protein
MPGAVSAKVRLCRGKENVKIASSASAERDAPVPFEGNEAIRK